MAKMIYRKDSGEILGVHILGLHAADLIHEASNAVATRQTVNVRRSRPAHPAPSCVWVCARRGAVCEPRGVHGAARGAGMCMGPSLGRLCSHTHLPRKWV